MAITSQSSILSSAANKIVSANINSTSSFVAARKEYQKFGDFIYIKTLELERSEIPNPNTIKKISRINVTNTFGSAAGLLSSFLGGALDVGGLIRGFFPGRDKKVGQAPASTTSKTKPKLKGSRLRISGGRALPIVGTLFAGLDFATGLAEGESIGKSAAGTAGSLAGSLLGGAIGQALIPVPGVGFVIGSAVGGFLGGWTADRAYDTGASIASNPKEKQEQKLEEGKKKEEPKVKEDRGLIMRQNSLISNFDSAVDKFSELVDDFISGKVSIFSDEMPMDEEPSTSQNREDTSTGDVEDNLMVEGGILPSKTYITSRYGESRKGYNHQGVDYASGKGAGVSPVSVIKPGVVTFARVEGDYGNVVFIKHPDGIESIYGHLHKINVKEGQKIEPGTVIGYEGSTGKSSGPHVHFELRRNNAKLPIEDTKGDEYFRFGGNVKVIPKPNTQSPVQSSAASELFNLEIHSPHKGEKQRSGLIRSVIDNESGMTRTLMGQFGSYEMGYRDLGAPKRGLNILETDMLRGVEYNAQRILAAIKANPNIHVNIFAGHNDLKKGEGETGAEGEMDYNRMVAERVEQLAKEQGVRNVTYIRSEYARSGTDPTSNWSKAKRLREEHIQRRLNSQVSARPSMTSSRDIAYMPSYNQPSFVALNNQIIAMNSPSTQPSVPSLPYSSSSPSLSGNNERQTDVRGFVAQMQEFRNSIA